jgi:hypothetical protein
VPPTFTPVHKCRPPGVEEKLFRQGDEVCPRRQERIGTRWRRMEIWKVLGNKCARWRILLVGGWFRRVPRQG